MRFQRDPVQVCDGLVCAHLRLVEQRRTILLAPDAFQSPSALRAALLEVWGRYGSPGPVTVRDRAEGALRVVREGPGVGIEERYVLRSAHHSYRLLYTELGSSERAGLLDPDELRFP